MGSTEPNKFSLPMMLQVSDGQPSSNVFICKNNNDDNNNNNNNIIIIIIIINNK